MSVSTTSPATLLRTCTLLLAIGAATAGAQPAALTFNPDDVTFPCGSTVTIDVVIDDQVTDLRGFSLVLAFDPAVLVPVAVTAGDLLTGAPCPHFFDWLTPSAPDSIAVDAAVLGCSVSGPGVLMRIEFAGVEDIDDGTSPLVCGNGRLRDGVNAPIVFDCGSATIRYTCPVAADQQRWATVKKRYR